MHNIIIYIVFNTIFFIQNSISNELLLEIQPQSTKQPIILSPGYKKHFTLDDNTTQLIHNITNPGVLPKLFYNKNFQQTTQSTWTRPTTPKDKLIGFLEQTLDKFLSGEYNNELLLNNKKVIEDDMLLFNSDKSADSYTKEEEIEGSGHDSITNSSISGIPKIFPNISKVPFDFQSLTNSKLSNVKTIIPHLKPVRSKIPESKFIPIFPESNIRRHPGNKNKYFPKTAKEFEYGTKPSYKQGIMSSMLDFLGLNGITNKAELPSELDHAITEWMLEHSPTYVSKAQKRAKIASSYNILQKFLARSVMPLCTPQPESIQNFNVSAFMGQWFQVMHSPLMSSSSCSIMTYKILNQTPNGIGSVFQTLEYSAPVVDKSFFNVQASQGTTTSGYAVVSRPGQLIYQKSTSPEDSIVHVIHVSDSPTVNGQYEYAVLSINCNYPLYVIARNPEIFQRKYERTVNAILERKGLINKVSRFLNIVKPVDFSQCLLPPNFFPQE